MSKKRKRKSRKQGFDQAGEEFMQALSHTPDLPKEPNFGPFSHEKCWHGHPVLTLGGGTFHGASCIHPHDGYDVYVGLDFGMRRRLVYPWHPSTVAPVEVYFPIKDGSVPEDATEFRAMVTWLAEQLSHGKKVHVGCIGGHGRTGLLLAALVCQVNGNPDAGAWVRQHYCSKAIETMDQVQWLKEHFGIDEVEPSRASWKVSSMVKGYDAYEPSQRYYTPVLGHSIWGTLTTRIT